MTGLTQLDFLPFHKMCRRSTATHTAPEAGQALSFESCADCPIEITVLVICPCTLPSPFRPNINAQLVVRCRLGLRAVNPDTSSNASGHPCCRHTSPVFLQFWRNASKIISGLLGCGLRGRLGLGLHGLFFDPVGSLPLLPRSRLRSVRQTHRRPPTDLSRITLLPWGSFLTRQGLRP